MLPKNAAAAADADAAAAADVTQVSEIMASPQSACKAPALAAGRGVDGQAALPDAAGTTTTLSSNSFCS